MQVFAAQVARLPELEREGVRALVPADSWSEIENAGTLSWLPLDVNLKCTHAVAAALGPERSHEFFRTLLLSAFKSPLLQALVDAVVRKLGQNPAASLSWVARGFDLLFDHCGTWQVLDRRTHEASLQVTGLPFVIADDAIWIESVRSSLHALLTIAQMEGTVSIRETDPKRGRVVFFLRTTPPG